ncbi:MAG: DedA family protein [Rhizobiaceae bacterium]|nr:DedA family protein [Rhizobiaceae bacterium]MBL4695867.1 DedA family protein [Rhizobiaceae bacterium]
MLRKLYDWVFKLAEHKRATWALAGFSFVESSFFPIPPDVLLIPMVLAKKHRWMFYAAICTVASILGAFLGYYIGAVLYESIGQPILAFYGKENAFDSIAAWYNKWGGWGVLFAAITPFPYKVLTIFSGATGLNFATFVIVSIVGRGLRFFIVAGLLYKVGDPIREFIEKRLGLMFTIGMVLLVGGFAAVKFIF